MRKAVQIFAWILFLAISQGVTAVVETYDFATDEQQGQYLYLTETLRCPKCQNQNISDSNAPIAQDLRREVHRLVSEGQSNDQIVEFMVDRFGDFVMYKPRLDMTTALLWFGPLLLGVAGIAAVVQLARKSRQGGVATDSAEPTALTDVERSKLKKMLKD
ncbi:MAG: cytochrome c-type biogenesis protein CcmH [Hahellaceae bacterium]|nr:cytochrome c-type biogenesis protein CcmH [Hahellaceae bacterium]MCP5212816.1 cytochrome c-type biogenesis protein CcmH [Hahellaceae bacterium]